MELLEFCEHSHGGLVFYKTFILALATTVPARPKKTVGRAYGTVPPEARLHGRAFRSTVVLFLASEAVNLNRVAAGLNLLD